MTASTPAAITIAAAATNLLRHDLRRNIRRPSMPVRNGSELDSGDLVEEPFRDRPDGAVADLRRVAAIQRPRAGSRPPRRRAVPPAVPAATASVTPPERTWSTTS